MPRVFKILLIGFVLGFELIFVAVFNPYPHGEAFDVRFRHAERVAAFMERTTHPSPESEARWRDELKLMHDHEDWKMHLALGLLVVVNGAAIYLFLRYEKRPRVA